MASITHKPLPRDCKTDITFDMVDKLYIGKGNCCRCGCGGDYFYPDDAADTINDCLKKMAGGRYDVSSIDNYIFEIVLRQWKSGNGFQTKVMTLYLKK